MAGRTRRSKQVLAEGEDRAGCVFGLVAGRAEGRGGDNKKEIRSTCSEGVCEMAYSGWEDWRQEGEDKEYM